MCACTLVSSPLFLPSCKATKMLPRSEDISNTLIYSFRGISGAQPSGASLGGLGFRLDCMPKVVQNSFHGVLLEVGVPHNPLYVLHILQHQLLVCAEAARCPRLFLEFP
uniref:Putative secreted protein n=1 Tax=Ixodes ricinus TaxID=34613 RepID=A0A6B0UHA7_IXORI